MLPAVGDAALAVPAAQAIKFPGTDANTPEPTDFTVGRGLAPAADGTAKTALKTPVVNNTTAPADEQEPTTAERVYAGGYTQSQTDAMAGELRQIRRDLEFAQRQWTNGADGRAMEKFSSTEEAAAEIKILEKRQKELEDILAAIAAEHEAQTRNDQYTRLASADDAPRFETEGRAAQSTYDTVNRELDYYISGNAPIGYEFQYTMEEAKEKKELLQKLYGNLTSMTTQARNAYMTQEQQRIYYTLLGKYGGEKAMEYYSFIRDGLTERQGFAEAQEILNEDNDILAFFKKSWYAAETGFKNSLQSIGQNFINGEAPTIAGNYGLQKINENASMLGSLWYTALESTARQAPSLIAGKMSGDKAVSYIFSLLNASGSAYKQKKQEGASDAEARLYSLLMGSSEIVLSELMGGLGEHSGLTEEAFLKKADKLDNIFARVASRMGIRLGSEIAEEELQLFLEPAIESALYGKDYDAPNWEEALETALVTAISTGLTEGGLLFKGETTPATGANTTAESTTPAGDTDAAAKPTAPVVGDAAPGVSQKQAAPSAKTTAEVQVAANSTEGENTGEKTVSLAAEAAAADPQKDSKSDKSASSQQLPEGDAQPKSKTNLETSSALQENASVEKHPPAKGESTTAQPEAANAAATQISAETNSAAQGEMESVSKVQPETAPDAKEQARLAAESKTQPPAAVGSTEQAPPVLPTAQGPTQSDYQELEAAKQEVWAAAMDAEANEGSVNAYEYRARLDDAQQKYDAIQQRITDAEAEREKQRKQAMDELQKALDNARERRDNKGKKVSRKRKQKTVLTPMTDAHRAAVKKKTQWPDEIVDSIPNLEEAAIYMDYELKPQMVNGRLHLIREIDFGCVAPVNGKTNLENMEANRAPWDPVNCEWIEKHHIGQNPFAPIAELAALNEHRGKVSGNNPILHPKRQNSWRKVPELKAEADRISGRYWQQRAMEEKVGNRANQNGNGYEKENGK